MKKLFLIPIAFLCLIACKHDVEEPGFTPLPEATTSAYFPLSIGNYWVYEFQTHMPDGMINPNITIDTLRVIGDTLLNDVHHFMLSTDIPSNDYIWYIRDVNGWVYSRWDAMVLPTGVSDILYNDHYGTNSLGDTLYYYQDQFREINTIPTLFGDQECMMQEATHIGYPLGSFDPVIDTSYYSPIGPVQRSFSFLSGAKRVGTLVDYYLLEE